MRLRTLGGWLLAVTFVTAAIATPPESLSLDGAFARLGVDRWHSAGFRGQGVKIAVLDTGFRGYRGFYGSTLPSRALVRSFRLDGDMEAKDSQHGIHCAEII